MDESKGCRTALVLSIFLQRLGFPEGGPGSCRYESGRKVSVPTVIASPYEAEIVNMVVVTNGMVNHEFSIRNGGKGSWSKGIGWTGGLRRKREEGNGSRGRSRIS